MTDERERERSDFGTPAHVLEGGDLDCGSGLVLLLREAMLQVPEGELLEMRSREPTVRDDLPPWCRMVGHEFLGERPAPDLVAGTVRYFVRRGTGEAAADEQALADDVEQARSYEWRARVRHRGESGQRHARVYCRNLQFDVGQPASFEERDEFPSAVELVLGALGSELAVGFATESARAGLELDDVELTVRGRLGDALAPIGIGDGDPSFARIDVKCFASSFDDEDAVRAAWARTVGRSPLTATLAKACELNLKLAIV